MKNDTNDHNGSEKLLTRREIYDFMSDFDKNLRSNLDFNEEIRIKHLDGSNFLLHFAFLKEDKMRVYIYTEHCGFFWFVKEDLAEMRRTVAEYNEKEEDIDIIEDIITVFDTGD